MSNTYIGQGVVGGIHLLKVGKANDIVRREKQIGIRIEFSIACLDADVAFRVETSLRQFVISQGGIRHPGTLDWFAFDECIYNMMKERMQYSHEAAQPALTEAEEIRLYVNRYYQLIIDEQSAKLAEEIAEKERLLTEKDATYQKLLAAKDERIEALLRDAMTFKIKLEMLEGKGNE